MLTIVRRAQINQRKPYSLVHLMLVAALLPVAAAGYSGDHSGLDFLLTIVGRAMWVLRHRKELTEAMPA